MRLGDLDDLKDILIQRRSELTGVAGDLGGALSGVIKLIDNAETIVNEYTKGFADGERSGRHFPLTDEEKAILVRQWQPQGEWIEYNATGKKQYMCSNCCMEEKNPKIARYCYWCGAKMKGGAE